MVRLKLMPPLTRIVGEKEVAVDVGRASLKAVLERAAARNGRFRRALLDAEGNLSSEYSCLVNGRRYNVSDLEGIEVDARDEIVILMPIAGGAPFSPLAPSPFPLPRWGEGDLSCLFSLDGRGWGWGCLEALMSIEVLVTTHVMGLDREREDAWPLALPAATVRLRDLIRAKVAHELAEYAAGRRGLVGKEYLTLDELAVFQAAAGRGQEMNLEAEEEIRRAWKAFEEGDYMVTVGTREVHDLDAAVALEPGVRVQFLRLLPVAGGSPSPFPSPPRGGEG